MSFFLNYLLTLLIILPLFACQKSKKQSLNLDNKSYIKDFVLLQENSINDTRVKITSPKAIIDPIKNDIEIFDSSIDIINPNGQIIKVIAGNSSLNNSENLIRVYNNVYISKIDKNNSFIKTNSFYWDLNKSNVNLNSPLEVIFENTIINSTNGFYNIGIGELKIFNNIFNRNIFNEKGENIYNITIEAELAKWLKDNNSLEFSSNDKQVETTINFLNIK